MKKTLKTTLIASAVALTFSGGALAAPPVGYNVGTNAANANPGTFDIWEADAGVISIKDLDTVTGGTQDCPFGWTCSNPMQAAGFYQRQLKDGSGNRYFQTIVTDTVDRGAVGVQPVAPSALDFADESYIKIGATGLADKQHIADNQTTPPGPTKTTAVFVTDVMAGSGWANYDTGADSMSVSQSLTETFEPDTLAPGIDYVANYNSFTLECVGASCATGKKINVVQGIMTEAQIDGADYTDNSNDDLEKFVFTRLSGSKNTAGHLAGPDLLPFATNTATDLAWAAGDDVSIMWLGQQFNSSLGSAPFGYMNYATWSGPETQIDSINDFTNEDTGVAFDGAPFNWLNPPFGAAPTMTIP